MKLKELFDKYTFDDIVPYLKEIITDNPNSLPDFRMAFDELRMMKPSDEDCDDILIKEFLDNDGNILANPVCWNLGYSWDECLAKRVVIDNDYPLDGRYVLAGCLWEMTFYGFSNMPDEEVEICFSIPKEPKNKSLDTYSAEKFLSQNLLKNYVQLNTIAQTVHSDGLYISDDLSIINLFDDEDNKAVLYWIVDEQGDGTVYCICNRDLPLIMFSPFAKREKLIEEVKRRGYEVVKVRPIWACEDDEVEDEEMEDKVVDFEEIEFLF